MKILYFPRTLQNKLRFTWQKKNRDGEICETRSCIVRGGQICQSVSFFLAVAFVLGLGHYISSAILS